MKTLLDSPVAVHHQRGHAVFVYGSGFGQIIEEPYRTAIEALFGSPADRHRVVDVYIPDTGKLVTRSTRIVVDAQEAREALHAIDSEGNICAGGPGVDNEVRILNLAADMGWSCMRGIPIGYGSVAMTAASHA